MQSHDHDMNLDMYNTIVAESEHLESNKSACEDSFDVTLLVPTEMRLLTVYTLLPLQAMPQYTQRY